MSSFATVFEEFRKNKVELRADYSNYIEWQRYVSSVLQFTGSGLDKYLDGHGNVFDEDERTQACNIIWDTLCHALQRDAALHALFRRADAPGLWAALEKRDLAQRNKSTAGTRVRAVEAVLALPLEEQYSQPLQTLLQDQMLARLQSRPSWYALEHLEAELKAAGVKRALAAQPGAEERAQMFEKKLDAVAGPLDHRGLEMICRETSGMRTVPVPTTSFRQVEPRCDSST